MTVVHIYQNDGNFLPADIDAANAVNLSASIDAFNAAVAAEFPDVEIDVEINRGCEGVTRIAWVENGDDDILASIEAVSERIFSAGDFWVNID